MSENNKTITPTDPPAVSQACPNLNSDLREATLALAEWGAAAKRVSVTRCLTHALLQGAYASEEKFSKFSDCPYSRNGFWSWAWTTGFDLGRRIHRLMDDRDELRTESTTLRERLEKAEVEAHSYFLKLVALESYLAGERNRAESAEQALAAAVAQRDEAVKELRHIAVHHIGTTYPVPDNEPPLSIQNRQRMGVHEDEAVALRKELAAAQSQSAATVKLVEAVDWIARIPCKENPPCSSRMDYACDSCVARAALATCDKARKGGDGQFTEQELAALVRINAYAIDRDIPAGKLQVEFAADELDRLTATVELLRRERDDFMHRLREREERLTAAKQWARERDLELATAQSQSAAAGKVEKSLIRLGNALLDAGPPDDIGPPAEVVEEYYAADAAAKELARELATAALAALDGGKPKRDCNVEGHDANCGHWF